MNAMRGAVSFTSDGAEHYLRFTTNAQARYQTLAGETLIAGAFGLAEAIDRREVDAVRLRRLFLAGLSHMPGLTEEKVGDMIDGMEVGTAPRIALDAVSASLPKPAKPQDGDPPAEADSGNVPAEATESPPTS